MPNTVDIDEIDGNTDDGNTDDGNTDIDDYDVSDSNDSSIDDDNDSHLSSLDKASNLPGNYTLLLIMTENNKENILESSKALLYEGSKIKAETSWYAIMQHAISNGLSYKSIDELISLIKVFCYFIISNLF